MTTLTLERNEEIIKKIGKRIFTLRKARGLSRERLAFKIGVSHQQLFKYEIGENRITVDKLILIAEILSFKLSDFFSANDFGSEIGNLSAPQTMRAIKVAANFSKFKKLSSEEIIARFLELIIKSSS